MLQIISGKFFESDERSASDQYGILYSNYQWVSEISTCIATLTPVWAEPDKQPVYIMKYRNQIEKDPVLVRIGDDVIVDQFESLCIFGLKAMFDIDRQNISLLCRYDQNSKHPIPHVPRYFDQKLYGKLDEIDHFSRFVETVIGLPRNKYNIIMKCLNAYSYSLKIVEYNFDLAYSSLIFCLETLVQNFDNYSPKWEDYPEHEKLDPLFDSIEVEKVSRIKETILANQNLKLQKRFVQFIRNIIADSFFTNESVNIKIPIRRSEIEVALKNAYNMRSSYAHNLQPILKHLAHPGISNGDVYHDGNNPYFTYSGLIRLSNHIISRCIFGQQGIQFEKYPWRNELPHTLNMHLSPNCWIWKTDSFNESEAKSRLSGFLQEYNNAVLSKSPITDCSQLMILYETIIPTAKLENKIPMSVHYYLYNILGSIDHRSPNFNSIIELFDRMQVLNICKIENLVCLSLVGKKWIWPINQYVEEYRNYLAKKHKSGSIRLPQLLEVLVLLTIANEYQLSEYFQEYSEWIDYAYLESTGNTNIQNYIWERIRTGDIVNPNEFLNKMANLK